MKHIIYLTTFAVLLLTGCSKPSPAPAPEQIDGYIFFSHDVETKAPLINDKADLAGQTFGVVGFKYSNDNATSWTTVKATAIPNVFATNPQTVTCDENGYGSYAPLQGWSNSKKYTFFAYYPSSLPLFNEDGSTPYTGGLPAIKYILNDESHTTLKNSMADVMIARPHMDLYQGSNVALSFNHCLSALGVKVNNLSEAAVTIESVSWVISGIKYKDAVIKLDGTLEPGAAFPSGYKAIVFMESLTVPTMTEDKNYPESVILIPQNDNLTLTINVEYTREATGYQGEINSSTLTTHLNTGKMHFVRLIFTDTKVEVKEDISEGEWANTHEVPSTFN